MVMNTADTKIDANDGAMGKLDYPIGNRTYGQKVHIAGTEIELPVDNRDFIYKQALAGRTFGCHWGTVTTPVATAATTAIALRRPMAWLRVPAGNIVTPINFEIVVESAGITTQGEIAVAITRNDVGDGTSSAGTSGAVAMNTSNQRPSNVTQRQLATADVAVEVALLELKRFSFAASAVNQMFVVSEEDLKGIVLYGPASFLVYIGGNAVNFFAHAQWLEFDDIGDA